MLGLNLNDHFAKLAKNLTSNKSPNQIWSRTLAIIFHTDSDLLYPALCLNVKYLGKSNLNFSIEKVSSLLHDLQYINLTSLFQIAIYIRSLNIWTTSMHLYWAAATAWPSKLCAFFQSYIYQVLQTIQMKLILLCVWAEPAVLGSAKTALKFKYKI